MEENRGRDLWFDPKPNITLDELAQIMEKQLGSGLLQDGHFGVVVRGLFPNATELDLYGASVHFDSNGKIVAVSCQGHKKNL